MGKNQQGQSEPTTNARPQIFVNIEAEFKIFLRSLEGAIDLDKTSGNKVISRKADFFLAKENAILEIKTINSDRYKSFESWINKKISDPNEIKKGMPVVFGTINFNQIYESHRNKKLFDRQLDIHASRTLEGYIRDAKYQIYETKKSIQDNSALGILVILNEGYEFYETWFVYRMIQDMLRSIKKYKPYLAIDGVLYINESRFKRNIIDVVFIHESNNLDDLTPNEFLEYLHTKWAEYRGYSNTESGG